MNLKSKDLIDSKILFLDNEEQFALDLKYETNILGLKKENIQITTDIDFAIKAASQKKINVFISDFRMSPIDGISVLESIRKENDKIILILYTGFALSANSDYAVRCKNSRIYVHQKFEGVETLLQNLAIYINKELDIGICYQNKLIKELSQTPQIISVEQPKIITDIKIINKSYLEIVKKNPNAIFNLTPRQFEEYTAELFEKRGYMVTITPETRDGGKDLLILQNSMLGDFVIYTECKKYSPDNPVGVRVVRELLGTITANRATAGIIVTSSYFSPDTITFTEQIKNQMSLVDFEKLKLWMNQIL